MSLIESALAQTPEQRLDEHQQVLDFALEIQGKLTSDAAR